MTDYFAFHMDATGDPDVWKAMVVQEKLIREHQQHPAKLDTVLN